MFSVVWEVEEEVNPPQPFEINARIPSFEIVVRRVWVKDFGSSITIEPKPM